MAVVRGGVAGILDEDEDCDRPNGEGTAGEWRESVVKALTGLVALGVWRGVLGPAALEPTFSLSASLGDQLAGFLGFLGQSVRVAWNVSCQQRALCIPRCEYSHMWPTVPQAPHVLGPPFRRAEGAGVDTSEGPSRGGTSVFTSILRFLGLRGSWSGCV